MRGITGVGYVSDTCEMATVEGRDYRKAGVSGGYEQNGEQVTAGGTRKVARGVKLDTRGGGELRVGRATFPAPDGRGLASRDCKALGAVATSSTRMNPTGMNLKRDKRDRSVTYRSVKLPGQVFTSRAAMLKALAA